MKIFLDTSSLFKLYHFEIGTEELENIFKLSKITHVYISEITIVEFASTLWKKVRTKEISPQQSKSTIELFEIDIKNYILIPTDNSIIKQAKTLITKYGNDGLRTLDSIQLSTCVFLKDQVDIFHTSDKLLNQLLTKENLKTTN